MQFAFDVLAADTEALTISGQITPWNTPARIAGVEYSFARGSIRLARARTPLLLDHDRTQPVGVLAQLTETEGGALATFRVDQTPLGDLALSQAASGSRGSFSIGADIHAADRDDSGRLLVTDAAVYETSLVSIGAIAGADVISVAAARETIPLPEPEDEPMPDEPTPTPDAAPRIRVVAEHRPALTAAEFAYTMLSAQRGDGGAIATIEAVLAETITTDVPGILPPSYASEMIGPPAADRPLFGIFGGRPIPNFGTSLIKPKVTQGPVGGWAASLDGDATTSTVTIGTQAANVERWDWAGALSWVTVERSDPDALQTIYSLAVENFYLAVEAKIAAKLAADAAGVATTIGAGIGEFFTAANRSPEVLIVAPDVWGGMADAKQLDAAVGAGTPSAGSAGLVGSFAGIPMYVSGNLVAGARFLATRRAIDARITDPVRITANAIGALNVELGVVGLGLFDTDYPLEILPLAAGVLGTRSAGKS
jgi:HK97 family phage prohead protease